MTNKIRKENTGSEFWHLRIGIHTGSVMAGVVGKRKFAYDIFGDDLNVASRCESADTPDRINISEDTYKLIHEYFECEERGIIELKNRGKMKMYYLNRILPEYAEDEAGIAPNVNFTSILQNLKRKDKFYK